MWFPKKSFIQIKMMMIYPAWHYNKQGSPRVGIGNLYQQNLPETQPKPGNGRGVKPESETTSVFFQRQSRKLAPL